VVPVSLDALGNENAIGSPQLYWTNDFLSLPATNGSTYFRLQGN
jgi:hypothetical protein